MNNVSLSGWEWGSLNPFVSSEGRTASPCEWSVLLGTNASQPSSPVWTARASGVQLMLAGIHRGWLDYFICASASLLPPYQPSPLLPQRGKPQRLRPKGACLANLSPVAAQPNSPGVSLGRGSGPGPPRGCGGIAQGGALPAFRVPDKALRGPCGSRGFQGPFPPASALSNALGL